MADAAENNHNRGWVKRLQAGDHQVFAEFVDKYKEMVFICCRTLGLSESEAEDTASETFLAAYKGLKKYKGKAKLSTWLWRIAYYQAVTYLRKNKKEKILLEQADEQIADTKTMQISAKLENKEQAQFIWQAVEKLPRLWTMAVILHYREKKQITDIAKIMRTPENTVKTYLFRARKRLQLILKPIIGEDVNG